MCWPAYHVPVATCVKHGLFLNVLGSRIMPSSTRSFNESSSRSLSLWAYVHSGRCIHGSFLIVNLHISVLVNPIEQRRRKPRGFSSLGAGQHKCLVGLQRIVASLMIYSCDGMFKIFSTAFKINLFQERCRLNDASARRYSTLSAVKWGVMGPSFRKSAESMDYGLF